ncbi:Clp protease N-terminal domain-containing protein [Streptomyces yaizuensis]|uniref:Peptidase n=1 Tax=Streptomyces yaizuensis TaxID=2989713 RepID=A0ABQ5NZP8_9ACTN|nr:Clp protease N-terminal domain-containing protein [Streptomyces sp. YSPA8]GLF95739.1 peptidase [Streptomyces sp. YSPA8]
MTRTGLGPGPGTGAGFTAGLARVVAAARRRALRAGDPQIDTAHLLHSLIEADPEARAALGPGSRAARVLGYLVQRSIGYGPRWRATVEVSGAPSGPAAPAVPAVPVESPVPVPLVGSPVESAPGWSPAAADALAVATGRAEARGAPGASGSDLLAALAADGGCRAVEVLRRAGVDLRGIGAPEAVEESGFDSTFRGYSPDLSLP